MSSVSEIRADLAAFMVRADVVEASLGVRPLMRLKADFNRDKHLTERGAKRHKRLWEDISARRKTSIDPALAGQRRVKDEKSGKYSLAPLIKAVFDVYALRTPGNDVARALIDLDETGNPEALKLLVEVAPALIKYSYSFSGGFRGFKDWANGYEDELPLDQNLTFGWLAALDYALWTNRDTALVPAKLQQDFSEFMTDGILKGQIYRSMGRTRDGKQEARQALWKSAGCDKLGSRAILDLYEKAGLSFPLDKYGHRLYHPTESFHTAFVYRSLQYGWREDEETRDRLAQQLDSAQGYVMSSKGELALQPHGIPARGTWLYGHMPEPLAEQSSQDGTYPRESMLTYELSRRAGSPSHSAREIAALCRTMVWAMMSEGPESDVCAAQVSGNGPKSLNGQNVVSIRDGQEVVRGSPVRAGRMEVKMPINALERGDNFIGARFTEASTIAEVVALNDKLPAGSRGNELSLFLCESKRL